MRAGVMVLAALELVGCSAGEDNSRQVVAATVAVLGSRTSRICIDSRTRGNPLTIFRTMTGAGERRALRWHVPDAIPASGALSDRQLVGSQMLGHAVRLAPPPQPGAPLTTVDQGRLDAAANTLSYADDTGALAVPTPDAAEHVTVRWSLLNRLLPGCDEVYALSNPVLRDGTAFVRVSAEHWGTIYALQQVNGTWRVAAEWSRWLQ